VTAVLFSLLLIVLDYNRHYIGVLRTSVSVLSVPIQFMVDYPVRVIGWVQSLVSSKNAIVNENIQLRYQRLLLEAELQKLKVIQKENSQLRELLQTATKSDLKSVAAHVLAVETDTGRQMIYINRGTKDGAFIGQPIIDAKGVYGQIVDVGPLTSTVLMISDSKSAIPVRNHRNGERAILIGNNDVSTLSLINLPRTSSFKVGDILNTSGLGNRYPEGLPVGRIVQINDIPGEVFIDIKVKPMALLNRDRLVLMLWPKMPNTETPKKEG
jgi:rod shape-determining protein MreC